ncbi:MAG: hypothetical protein ABL985_10265 [Casimicrobium sp.]
MNSPRISRLALSVKTLIVIGASLAVAPQAFAQVPVNGCQFQAAEISKALGTPFGAGQGKKGIGPSCTYTSLDGKQKLSVVLFPTQSSFDAVRTVIGPTRTTELAAVAKDDNQAHIVRSSEATQVAHIAYINRGHLVQLRLTMAPSAMRSVEPIHTKLLALRRV